jgi:phage gp36-like protein
MAYCVLADIVKDFPGALFDTSDNSKVKSTAITDFIVDADALIDGYVSARYVVPVTAPKSLALLKFYSRTLVSDKVKGILEVKQATNASANQNVRSGLSTKDVIKILEGIADGSTNLPDAALILDSGGINSFNVREGIEPEFKKDTPAW